MATEDLKAMRKAELMFEEHLFKRWKGWTGNLKEGLSRLLSESTDVKTAGHDKASTARPHDFDRNKPSVIVEAEAMFSGFANAMRGYKHRTYVYQSISNSVRIYILRQLARWPTRQFILTISYALVMTAIILLFRYIMTWYSSWLLRREPIPCGFEIKIPTMPFYLPLGFLIAMFFIVKQM